MHASVWRGCRSADDRQPHSYVSNSRRSGLPECQVLRIWQRLGQHLAHGLAIGAHPTSSYKSYDFAQDCYKSHCKRKKTRSGFDNLQAESRFCVRNKVRLKPSLQLYFIRGLKRPMRVRVKHFLLQHREHIMREIENWAAALAVAFFSVYAKHCMVVEKPNTNSTCAAPRHNAASVKNICTNVSDLRSLVRLLPWQHKRWTTPM